MRNEQTCKRVFEAAEVQSGSLGALTETVTILGNKLIILTEAHNHLTEEIAGYVADGRERMKQMEAGLDALIRIITAEHSNGKGNP